MGRDAIEIVVKESPPKNNSFNTNSYRKIYKPMKQNTKFPQYFNLPLSPRFSNQSIVQNLKSLFTLHIQMFSQLFLLFLFLLFHFLLFLPSTNLIQEFDRQRVNQSKYPFRIGVATNLGVASKSWEKVREV